MTEKAVADAIALIDSVVSADGDYSRLGDADLVIEAVPELMPLKEKVLSAIAAHAGPRAIIASNTSSISMTVCYLWASSSPSAGWLAGIMDCT
eukprot:COSAG01_NODE_12084_length_1806_cov_1.964202_2_plen_93_part_00